jgi:hypothetical protein
MSQWIERWHGSGPDRGWWVWETNHGNPVAYVGEGEHSERLTSILVQKHNAALVASEPVAEVVAGTENYGAVRFTGPIPPKGTKLFAAALASAPQADQKLLEQAGEALESCTEGGYRDIDGDWCERLHYDKSKVAAALAAIRARLGQGEKT